ncbi:mediator of RNA polymerase II transcription subunit 17 [Colletotrichum spaethianum]|uniref:Mediator of RNA polymerase II transcription subunit 17 n=1 Tax=Colletotrichum spaethianum TaxID=700344 RepID=A0AA37UK34_9PEZI|nr:mediator of RNA polymerase II transcription subunit 17 [Colletotrichum spaethianum]GKT50774.1 mediator of RNA polymerase II transcription subunit 17 [Colletotrichum spaethianum]
MASGSSMPFSSLHPVPTGGRKPKSLGEFIARVQSERGFRNVTEESLKEEVENKKNGEAEVKEEDTAMSDGDDDNDEEPPDAGAARMEVLRNIESWNTSVAQNAAFMTLNFISLLLSKESPAQAGVTLSQALRDWTGIGTLGIAKREDNEEQKQRDSERAKDNRDVSLGWALLDIETTKGSADKAASHLSKEVEREAKYWDEVLAVHQAGWSMCRLPAERHTLGVRFGFSEASPEFRNSSLAPLRRGDDGTALLQHGRVGAGSQRLSITVSRSGETTGRLAIGSSVPDSALLPDRVLEARNTIFAQELWHELHREAHSLASYGVRANNDSINFNPTSGPSLTLELETLDDSAPTVSASADNVLAEATHLGLHILLSHAHRLNELQRLRPTPPHQRRNQAQNQYHLFRPIIAKILYDRSVEQVTSFAGDLTRVLRRAGVHAASFTLNTPQFPTAELKNTSGGASNRPNASQALTSMLTSPADFQVELTLTPTSRLQIRGRTFLLPLTTTQFQLQLLPSLAEPTDAEPAPSTLQVSYPPSRESYPNFSSVQLYLASAAAHALTDFAMSFIPLPPSQPSEPARAEWTKSVRGTAIRDIDTETREIRFDILNNDPESRLTLQIGAAWRAGDKPLVKRWAWPAVGENAGKSATQPHVSDIVAAVVQSKEI